MAPASALWSIGAGAAATFTSDGTTISISFDPAVTYTVPSGDPVAGSYQAISGTLAFSAASETAPGVYTLTSTPITLGMADTPADAGIPGTRYLGMTFVPESLDFNTGTVVFQSGGAITDINNSIGSTSLDQFAGGAASLTMTFSGLAISNSGFLTTWSGSAVTAYGSTPTATPEPQTYALWGAWLGRETRWLMSVVSM